MSEVRGVKCEVRVKLSRIGTGRDIDSMLDVSSEKRIAISA